MSGNLYEEFVETNSLYNEIDKIVGRIIKHGLRHRNATQADYTQEILAVVDSHCSRQSQENCINCIGDQKPETD